MTWTKGCTIIRHDPSGGSNTIPIVYWGLWPQLGRKTIPGQTVLEAFEWDPHIAEAMEDHPTRAERLMIRRRGP